MTGFSRAVAISDDAVFVSEPLNRYVPGMVHVYEKEMGEWTRQTVLTAPDAEWGDHFGQSIAVEDGWMLVGAIEANGRRGAAFLYENTGAEWMHVASLLPEDVEAGDNAGATVALQGDVAVIGAPTQDSSRGAVYVFEQMGGSWMQMAELTASNAEVDAGFGSTLALTEGHLVIGAAGQDSARGAAYVFHQTDDGSWEEAHILTDPNIDPQSSFGATLAMRDNMLLVGAPRANAMTGAVYVYEHGDEFELSGRLLPYNPGMRTFFGVSSDLTDEGAWVGALGANGLAGGIYRFDWSDGEWTGSEMLSYDEAGRGYFFGMPMAVEGDVAVAGSQRGEAVILEKQMDGSWEVETVLESTTQDELPEVAGESVMCEGGDASLYDCSNVNLLSFMPISSLGGEPGINLNDLWGWTDDATGAIYALVGRTNGLAFVDITDPLNPVYVGQVPMTPGANAASWRDFKTYEDHVFIVADGSGAHGMQVFDLTRLREFEGEPITFEPDVVYDEVDSSHNIAINTNTGYAFIVGAGGGAGIGCGGGLHMVNIQDPMNPEFVGCFQDEGTGRRGTGYTHDVQCVTYHGPDEEHQGSEICFALNETALSIADVTDKDNPVSLASPSYPGVVYAHQGWLTEDHEYFYSNDEIDELAGTTEQTRTLVWDVRDLDDPQLVLEYTYGTVSSDHNLYIEDGIMYQSNYASGLRVHDVSDPLNPRQIAFFDTTPGDEDEAGYTGTWSNYPYFPNGVVGVTSTGQGFFVLKVEEDVSL